MDTLTHMWVAMIGLVALSVFAFVGLTVWAWRDNVVLVKHWGERLHFLDRRIRERWRRWREPEYRAYQELNERYDGPVLLLSGLQLNEDTFRALQEMMTNDKEREHCRRECDKFRETRIKCAPHVAQQLAAFNDAELATLAESMAGFSYDNRPQTDDDAVKVERALDLLTRHRDMLQACPEQVLRVISELETFFNELD